MQEPLSAAHGKLEHERSDSARLAQHWQAAFNGHLGPLPRVVHAPCCAGELALVCCCVQGIGTGGKHCAWASLAVTV